MAETKYGKYIIDTVKPSKLPPRPPSSGKRGGEMLVLVDDEVLPGAFYLNCALIWNATGRDAPGKSHTHDFDEYIGFIGSNPENPRDLGGEVEIYLGDEKHVLTKSCAVFVPRGLPHTPVYFIRVDRPIFYFSTGPNPTYTREDTQ
jgi:hypothetical protein